jgi:hypothetical protein
MKVKENEIRFPKIKVKNLQKKKNENCQKKSEIAKIFTFFCQKLVKILPNIFPKLCYIGKESGEVG